MSEGDRSLLDQIKKDLSPSGGVFLFGVLIFLATFLVYFPALQAGFLWDDRMWILENKTFGSWSGLREIWLNPLGFTAYYPFTATSFWLEHFVWQFEPFGYHLTNVLLHALNSILIGILLTRFKVRAAWFAAAIFALHPVNVESVAWITERKNVLSYFFYLVALGTYLRSGSWRTYLLALGLFACALLSKTVTCTLPFAILILLWWKNGRLERRDFARMVPFFVLGLGAGLVLIWTEHSQGAQGAGFQWSFLERLLIAGRAFWFYLGKLFWPGDLSYIYPKWAVDTKAFWQYLYPVGLPALFLLFWVFRRQFGIGPPVGQLFLFVTLAPALGFVNHTYMQFSFAADHFQYHAMIGPVALFATAFLRLFPRLSLRGSNPDEAEAISERRLLRRPFGLLAMTLLSILGVNRKGDRSFLVGLSKDLSPFLPFLCVVSILMTLSLLTWQLTPVYKDEETFWRYNLSKNPEAWISHYNLGVALQEKGDLLGALDAYSSTLRLKPDYAEAHNNLGLILNGRGNVTEALLHFRAALRSRPDYSAAHTNLGIALAKQGRIEKAVFHFSEALRLDPHHEGGIHNLQAALARKKNAAPL